MTGCFQPGVQFPQDRRTFCPEFSPVGASGSAGALFAFRTVGSGVSGRELFSGKGVFSRLGCGVSGLWFGSGADTNCPHSTGSLLEPVFFHGGAQRFAAAALGRLGAAGGCIGPLLPGTLVAGRAGGFALCSGACPAAALAEFISGIVPFYRGRFGADTLPGIFRTDLSLPGSGSGARRSGCRWAALGCRRRSVLEWHFYLRTAGGAACPAMSCCVPGHWEPFLGSTQFFCFLWLAAMFFRICVLAHILRLLWEKFRGRSVCEVSP